MKRICRTVLVLVLCAGLAACKREPIIESTTTAESTTEALTTEIVEEVFRVAVLYDINLDGTEYQESCMAGISEAEERYEVEIVSFDMDLNAKWEEEFLSICDEGFDLVIGTSAGFADGIAKHGGNYPEISFAVLDAAIEGENVRSICFSQKEGYYLAGILATVIAGTEESEQQDISGVETRSADTSKENSPVSCIGWVTGVDIPMVREWFEAYELGAKAVNPDIQVLWHVAGQWEDSEIGKEWISELVNQGAEAVMYVPFDIAAAGNDATEMNSLYLIDEKLYEVASVEKIPGAAVLDAVEAAVEDVLWNATVNLTGEDGAVAFEVKDALEEVLGKEKAETVSRIYEEKKEDIGRI